ncbi:MAG: NAD(P)-dependent oxidoreductase [Planctomycetia bacterium]|jgi:nucleoside-diphosphate-sugar epimerase
MQDPSHIQNLPESIQDVEQLDKMLSQPWPKTIEYLRDLDGDIMVIGATGKIGPSITRCIKRAIDASGSPKRVFAVARRPMPELAAEGIETIQCDILDLAAVQQLPQVKNLFYLVGRKFGSAGQEELTWAMNVLAPSHVARTFTDSRIVDFSTGCVYPIEHISSGGSTEMTPPAPVGEYAMSCLGRERAFDYHASTTDQQVVHLRLNYAVEMRYGVLVDVATNVFHGKPIDLTTGYANVIWQGDANNQAILALSLASNPAEKLNVTGPEMISIREVATEFGKIFGREPIFTGEENGHGYLSNSTLANQSFGCPRVPLGRIIEWTADWIARGNDTHNKPTHFEVQDGTY